MVTLHGGLARATVFSSLIMGLWALWRFMRREEASPGFSGALVIAEILYLAQGVIPPCQNQVRGVANIGDCKTVPTDTGVGVTITNLEAGSSIATLLE